MRINTLKTPVVVAFTIVLMLVLGVVLPAGAIAQGEPCPDFFWQNPLPQGNDLHDIAAIDTNSAIAVGNNGTILKTDNGGNTWETVASGTTEVLTSVTMGNAATGWICGEGEVLLKTVDGGETWSQQSPSVPGDYSGVSAVNASVAWVAGSIPGNGSIVMKTIDGGENWIDQSPPGTILTDISAVDSQTAWAIEFGDGVYRTTNGGDAWTFVDTPSQGIQSRIQAFSGTTAYIVGHSGQFMKTTDGTNWTRTVLNKSIDLRGLAFLNTSTGWVVGDSGFIAMTGDRGQTWSGQDSRTTASLMGCSARTVDSVWACGSSGVMLKTAAAGSWTNLSHGDVDGLFDITSIGERTAWAAGFDGTIQKTTDGGATWTPKASGVTCDLFGISAANLDTAWAVGDVGTIIKTTDGGDSWFPQQSGINMHLASVSAVSPTVAWASGNGVVLRTTDGGTTWSRLDPGSDDMLIIDAIDSSTAYCASKNDPLIFKTTDGGKTWKRQTLSAPGMDVFSVTDICVVDSKTAVASTWVSDEGTVGNFSLVFKTTDGERWTSTMEDHTRLILFGIGTHDGINIWACGMFGFVVRSSDGGRSWEEQDSGVADKILQGVNAANDRVAWVVGLGGVILRTTAPTPYSIAPDSGLSSSTVSITDLAGNGFQPGMKVQLTSGNRVIDGTDVDVISPYRATCRLDLRGAPAGAWDVVLTNTNGGTGRLRGGFHVASGKTWYLAEGSTGMNNSGEFKTWILIQNPGKEKAEADITYLTAGGEVAGPKVTLEPESRLTVDVSETLPDTWDVSTRITADREIIAQRAMYWDTAGTPRQATSGSIGTPFTSRYWFLAEGSTGQGDSGGFETWVLVSNPGEENANIAVTYLTPNGRVEGPGFALSAGSRSSIRVSDVVPNEYSVSSMVESDRPVVAERSVYWSTPTTHWEEAHNSIGTMGLARQWYLAEGSTGIDASGSFETWAVVGNPTDVISNVQIEYQTPAGRVEGPSLVMGPYSRTSVNASDSVPNEFSVSTRVISDNPVVAERAVYWNTATTTRLAAQSSVGSQSPSRVWDIAEGSTAQTPLGGFETWILVQNPGDDAVVVTILYMTPDGPVPGPRATLAPRSRSTFAVGDTVPNEWSVSTRITATGPVAAEVALYWSAPDTWRLSAEGSRGFSR